LRYWHFRLFRHSLTIMVVVAVAGMEAVVIGTAVAGMAAVVIGTAVAGMVGVVVGIMVATVAAGELDPQ
jgi:hypothetical protein